MYRKTLRNATLGNDLGKKDLGIGQPGLSGVAMKKETRLKNDSGAKKVNCPVCEIEFIRKRKTQVCCSRDCYLTYWAMERLLEKARVNHVNGLRPKIQELARLKK